MPHSEISGSKPIPGSPELIAGYHVLHRLLLPRHPPNALIALDLIQKEQDCRAGSHGPDTGPFVTPVPFRSEASYTCLVPCKDARQVRHPKVPAVSVLDLDSFVRVTRGDWRLPHAEAPHETDVSLSINDVNANRGSQTSERTIQQAQRLLDDPFITGGAEDDSLKGADASRRIRSRTRRGGAYRDRTDDLLNANQALSQLS